MKPVALITGATSGIGREGAIWLARDGFHVVAAGRNAGRGAATVAACEAAGGSAEFIAFDVCEEAGWEAAVSGIVARHARLDAVVNSAGAFFSKPLPDTSLAEFRALWEADVESVMLGTKWAMRAMRDTASAGSIVNISSLAGLIGLEDCAAYCAAKAAVTHFSKIAAVEGGGFTPPIRVNSLNPGVILTEMITHAYGDSDAVRAFVKDGNALDMVGEARHVAAAIAWLAGPKSRMVTGTAHVVDGGRGSD
ncbi:SDR family NAD(P)-dependent oxidoreductase [Sandaracinobacteroides saxicola]|uniref:SDR family oxidoreductase n=1 Tax=Sandaracinobacteroides saxicola TaxID=2759707 RepID=A0A7G5IEY2_9SPHN|nr:SDR family oxidoreductase [Sandaracinobacteroides saxicola]QMW21924.1 SDR family oxidoreductase [Sandaracinobacteroides saxicola]